MDIAKALAELHDERKLVDEAILALSQIAAKTKRRGRPPSWLAGLNSSRRVDAPGSIEPLSGRKGMSASARKAQSERMKKYWAERHRKKK